LIAPEEALGLPPTHGLIFLNGEPKPIVYGRVNYLEAPLYNNRADRNPYHAQEDRPPIAPQPEKSQPEPAPKPENKSNDLEFY
jgi:type IV secretory pathway TraG/TraD family ATPase VirD4